MSRTPRFSEAAMLAGLRAAAAEVGEPLTVKAYDDWRSASRQDVATGIWIIRAFGTWTAACKQAGVKANTTRSTSRRWTEDQLVAHVAAYLAQAGGSGSFAGYAEWAKATEGAPSGATLRASLPWSVARERAQG